MIYRRAASVNVTLFYSRALSILAIVLIATACDHKSSKPLSMLEDIKPQPFDQTRIMLQPINTSNYPTKQWNLRAVANYLPVDSNQPNATETTKSRKNCQHERYSLNIHLTPCTRTYDRRVERVLTTQQIGVDASQALYLDYFREIKDQEADFRIDSLAVTIKECPECQEKSYDLDISCWADEVTNENIQTNFYGDGGSILVRYHPEKSSANSSETCGLRKEEHVGSFTRDSVLKVLRGQFHMGDYMSHHHLLDTFPAIPTKDSKWIANKSHGRSRFSDFCPLASGQSYDRTDLNVRMDSTNGWRFLPDVEVLVYKEPNGEVCGIWLDGSGEFEAYTPRVRYFFSFEDGQLALLNTEEPNGMHFTWRYESGEPFEYIQSQEDVVAGDEEIRYWHRDAAREWPERMDFTPDFTGFSKQREFANYLLNTYGRQQASVNNKASDH